MNTTLGQYVPLNSIIHKLDPRVKIISLVILLVTVFIDAGWIGYLTLGVFTLLLLLLSKLKISQVIKSIKPLLMMMVVLSIFNLLFIRQGNIVFHIWKLSIYDAAINQSAYICIRLVLIIVMTTVLTASTKPLDLTLGLEHLLNPLKKLGFPTHEVSMMISIALRFIPTLMEETQRIMKAQASRGVDFNNGTLKEKINSLISLIIPLFISSFQRAEELANAMESRNYNPEATRTRYKQLKWRYYDTFTISLVCALSIGIIVESILL